MTPTLFGRIQTRIFLVWTVGLAWVLCLMPLIAVITSGLTVVQAWNAGLVMLLWITALGIAWEVLYHGLMQFRWEKDWPTGFGLLTALNEGLVLWLVEGAFSPGWRPPAWIFVIAFNSTWLLIFLVANGPMRVVSLRWRFRGGRLI